MIIVGTGAARRISDVVSVIRVLIVVDWSMFVVDGLLSVLNLGVVRFVVGQVGGAKHGMLMEVNGLDIMLIIVAMVELTVHGMSCMVEGRSLQMVRLWRPSVLRLNRVMLAQ